MTSNPAFRGEGFHTKVKAVVFFCFIDKKIFQSVLTVCGGKRFFADRAMNQMVRKFRLRTHANNFVARCASWTHEIDSFSHDYRLITVPSTPDQSSLMVVAGQTAIRETAMGVSLPKSPVRSSSGDEVPHMFTRKPRLRPGKFSIRGAKRLLQHNLPQADMISGSAN